MPVIFDEILFDLELKRAAALDPVHRRPVSEGSLALAPTLVAIAGETRRRDAARGRDDARRARGAAHGDERRRGRRRRCARRARGRARGRAAARWPRRHAARADHLRPLGARGGGADRPPRAHGREGPRALPHRRARPVPLGRRIPAADPPLRPGRALERGEDRARGAQGLHLGRARLGAGRRGRGPRVGACPQPRRRLRGDRAGAGPRAGGARPLGQHARRRALHRLPRRACVAARGLGRAGSPGAPDHAA